MRNELVPEQQFDFWLGEWDVIWGEEQHGTNRIEKILDGRVIQENFNGNPAMPFRGMSLSVYKPQLGKWLQTWVDTEGNYWHFTGEYKDGRMTLSTQDKIEDKMVELRMVFYNISENELDWNWEQSEDGGQTWQLKWHIHYRRKGTAQAE